MDLEKIEGLIKFLKENEVAEFEYGADEGPYLRVKLASDAPVVAAAPVAAIPQMAAPVAAPAAAPAVAPAPADDASLHEVVSPMVGTFYTAPSPDAAPFVKVGDRVAVGQTLCIVEAMKLMNEIESDASGVVEAVLVENAQPIQFGQPLFKIRAG